jgi:DNA-directed RNA polymerase subunit omega
MNPPIESLLDKVDSKFTLVALSSKRARQINSYYNQLGEGLGVVVPPQVASVSGKPLTIAFEEVAAGKATFHRIEPGEEGDAEVLAAIAADDGITAPGETTVDFLAVGDPAPADTEDAAPADADLALADPALTDAALADLALADSPLAHGDPFLAADLAATDAAHLAGSEKIDAPGDETEPPADQ